MNEEWSALLGIMIGLWVGVGILLTIGWWQNRSSAKYSQKSPHTDVFVIRRFPRLRFFVAITQTVYRGWLLESYEWRQFLSDRGNRWEIKLKWRKLPESGYTTYEVITPQGVVIRQVQIYDQMTTWQALRLWWFYLVNPQEPQP